MLLSPRVVPADNMRTAMTILRLAAAVSLLAWSTHVAAQAPVAGPSSAVRAARSTSRVPPGARANVLTTIQGNALTSTNGPLAAAVVRLRDARTGKVVDVQTTDEADRKSTRLNSSHA